MKTKDRGYDRKIYAVSRMNHRSLLVLMLAFVASYSFAQQQSPSSYEVQMIPENPDVADLGKFGDIPVNKYNGTANVTVHIHEIDLDGLKIPIVLRYNTSGVRVNQDASWVGLGWSLSEGMSITREVNGFEDIRNADQTTESIGWIYTSGDYLTRDADNCYNPEMSAEDLLFLDNQYALNIPHDLQPDVFSVNLPGGSFKFYLPKIIDTETILTGIVIDEKNYKVSFDINDDSFEVTDKNGFIYSFTETENSTGFGSYDASPTNTDTITALQGIVAPIYQTKKMISSWKVSTITSPYGNNLNFTYQEGFYMSYPHYSEKTPLYTNSGNNSYSPAESELNFYDNPLIFASFNAFHVKYLTKISGDFGAVEFNLSDRVDLFSKVDKARLANETSWEPLVAPSVYSAKKLDNIQVVDPNNQVVKTAQLQYSYFNNQWVNDIDKVSHIRLKLESVDILNRKYQFQYYNPDALPRKNSKSIDFWGFYNGVANTIRIPSMNRFYLVHMGAPYNDQTFERFYKRTGASRKSDINFGKTGILTRVTYPTGGYTEFDYEGNSVTLRNTIYTPSNYLPDGQLEYSGIRSTADYNFRYQYLKLANNSEYSLVDYSTCKLATENVINNGVFEITEASFCNNQTYNVKVQANLSCSVGCGQGINPTGLAVWIENINTSQVYNIYYYDGQFGQSNLVTLEQEMNLPVGNYILKSSNWSTNTPFLVVATTTASATVWHDASIFNWIEEEFEVGGARVKKVANYDSDGSFINAKSYNYNGSVTSSGKLMDDLVFTTMGGGLYEYTPELFSSTDAIAYSDNRLRTASSAAGSHIGYSMVTELQIDELGSNNGKIISTFSNYTNEYITRYIGITPAYIYNAPLFYYCDPCEPSCYDYDYTVSYDNVYVLAAMPISYGHSNGSVLIDVIEDGTGNQVRNTTNTYQELIGAPVPYTSYPIMMFTGDVFTATYPYRLVESSELKIRKFNKIKTTTTTDYLDGNQLSSFTEYFYDNPSHYLLSRTESTDSESALRTSNFYYPQDIQTDPFMADLISANRLSQRIKSESYKGVTLLFTEHTKYDNTTSTNGLVLPKEVFTYPGTLVEGEENQRVLYERYDTKGHLLQYRRKDNNIPITLIWSYNKQYPVAKIENATFQQVASVLQITETTLMNFNKNNLGTLDALRSALPNALVYIYSYDPLVGMTSQTDPNGKSTTYNYDDFNRLKTIEDFDGNVIKAYEYHYK